MTNVNLTDSLTDGDGNQLNLTNGPYFISSSLGSNTTLGTIKVGEILTYEALYIIQGNTILVEVLLTQYWYLLIVQVI